MRSGYAKHQRAFDPPSDCWGQMTVTAELPFPCDLPVVEVLPSLRSALQQRSSVVLEAPPGAGKSTVVPLALLQEPWLQGRRIVMLEPRRLATRAVAERMAHSLKENVGQTVGYRMRLDTRVSAATRLEVVTEGILVRLLQQDPALEGVGLVIFDEFHERNLQSDLGLALLLDACSTLGSDLKILVMSATLDTEPLQRYLPESVCITAQGRQFPVQIVHIGEGFPALPGDGFETRVLGAIRRAIKDNDGDILVFLPGAGEIRRVMAGLEERPATVRVVPLYGELPAAEQDAALQPARPGERKVVLATNIAETSLTLPGVRVVIDSGLVRRSRFDPATGMSRLDTARISRASADQRAGRAGRVAAGVCYRLWSAGIERSLATHTPPEILEADLAPLALDLALWGTLQASALSWLDAPPQAMFEVARSLLHDLDLLDAQGRLTPSGRQIAEWPLHPRLGRLLWASQEHNCVDLGANLAALLSERDPLRATSRRTGMAVEEDVDLLTRLTILLRKAFNDQPNPGVWRRIERQAAQLCRLARSRPIDRASQNEVIRAADQHAADVTDHAARLLAMAFPDRIAQPREAVRGRYLLSNGRGAQLRMPDALASAPYLVAIELDDREREATIRLAVALTLEQLEQALGSALVSSTDIHWSTQEQAIVAREQRQLGSLILASRAVEIDDTQRSAIIIQAMTSLGLDVLPWTDEARQLCARVELLRQTSTQDSATWPEFSESALLSALSDWLEPWLTGVTRQSHFSKIPLLQALKFRLGPERHAVLTQLMPETLVLPTGTRTRIDYMDDLAPMAAMRMQEVFGLATTPRIAGGRLPITFKLLSPAGRPLQVTRDLASFWQNAYSDVRKDMRGRYPKHYWPENPLEAEPTRRIKPRT